VLTRRAAGWKGPGIVVGISERGTHRFVSVGQRDGPGSPGLDPRTEFEIGSITKVFTGILLADLAQRGEVGLDDPIAGYVPPGTRVPEWSGQAISLLDLATQSSALPRMPDNMAPRDAQNPYADYGLDRMYQFLGGYRLPRAPGERYEYSNFGMGLLGQLLAGRLGLDYDRALTRRVLDPLGLNETRIRLSGELAARFATGHSAALAPTSAWEFQAFAPAGALRSTAEDMLRFLDANLHPERTRLERALESAAAPRRPTGTPNTRIGLGWHILERNGRSIMWHNGGTGGFHAFIAFERDSARAVVVLANAAQDIDDIGLHLMDRSLPLREPAAVVARTEIKLDPATLDRFVGEYQLAPTFSIIVTKENGALWAQATGQPKFPIFPEAAARFFYKVVDAQITFTVDSAGTVTGLTLYQNGNAIPGPRIP
jgi:CubicO group peptidase (beta-lactamase class C family)